MTKWRSNLVAINVDWWKTSNFLKAGIILATAWLGVGEYGVVAVIILMAIRLEKVG